MWTPLGGYLNQFGILCDSDRDPPPKGRRKAAIGDPHRNRKCLKLLDRTILSTLGVMRIPLIVVVSFTAPGADSSQITPALARDVNPIWNHTVIVEKITMSDAIKFTVRDVGMVSTAFAHLGPVDVCCCSYALSRGDFEGFLEMIPSHAVRNNGWPVLEVSIRCLQYRGELPAIGTATAIRSMLDPQPSAPLMSEAGDFEVFAEAERALRNAQAMIRGETAQNECAEFAATGADVMMSNASGGADVQVSTVSAASGSADAWQVSAASTASGSADVQACAVQASCAGVPVLYPSWAPGTRVSRISQIACTFLIDEAAINFSRTADGLSTGILGELFKMQGRCQVYPFPSDPLRNYNAFGCGFDTRKQDWPEEMKWRGATVAFLDQVQELVPILKKLFDEVVRSAEMHVPYGLKACVVLLEHLQACSAHASPSSPRDIPSLSHDFG